MHANNGRPGRPLLLINRFNFYKTISLIYLCLLCKNMVQIMTHDQFSYYLSTIQNSINNLFHLTSSSTKRDTWNNLVPKNIILEPAILIKNDNLRVLITNIFFYWTTLVTFYWLRMKAFNPKPFYVYLFLFFFCAWCWDSQ